MAAFEDTVRSYDSLQRALEREHDPERRKWMQQQADALFAAMQAVPAHERGDGVPAPEPKKSMSEFASSIEMPGSAAAPAASEKPAAYPEFDPKRDEYMRREAASMGKPLPEGFLSSKPAVASATPDVAAAVQPNAPPQPRQGSNPLSFPEFSQLFGGGGGARVNVKGAMANAGAASDAASAAFQNERNAILARGQQQEADGVQLGETMATFAQSMKASDEEHQQYLAQARSRIGDLIEESKVAAEEFRAATREQGLMASLSTGGRVGAAISLALGALGGGLTGQGNNAAMDVLKMRIDEDLRNRSLNINAKGQALDGVDRLLSRNMQIFGDEISARAAARSAIFGELDLEVKRQAAISGGVDANMNAQQISAGMLAEKARSDEALAQQQLIAMQKAARAGGGMNKLKLLKEYQAYLKNDIGIQTDATKLDAMQSGGGKPDIHSAEGKRASDRTTRLRTAVEPYDKTVQQADTLLTKVGVPSVQTRMRAGIGDWLTDPESSTLIKLTPVGLLAAPLGILSNEENQQMGALFAFTAAKTKASQGSGQLSEGDMKRAIAKELRQTWLVSQEALTAQIRNDRESALKGRARALRSDRDAAAELGYEVPSDDATEAPRGSGIPDYGRSF